ncbi:hypothetical protein SAMN05892883_2075 [Jatrophihabitans sp. GAS493]|uniref:SU10 major capsid protein n=1 Tax=Jatrophihabitans sp. GAS493 TaxID=1907575 RepID=UPI000BB7E8F7|nr:DUF5309 family protein [Jatrophihabitans sp. GAS493]SOD72726.1 hypothetical protein SAMN05892883_2075 [Jatrophihabitans sp. GAS493]
MAGAISGMGTTFNLPNYVGELFSLTPKDTPLLSAIGGLTGGGMTTAPEFEWQRADLRSPGQNVALEGATAPTGVARVRDNVRNVCEVHQSKVSLSYTKQSSPGQLTTPSSAPYHGVPGTNPVTNELDWQIEQELAAMALDVNWTFINGVYQLPTDNTTPRKTRGLLAAITTNVAQKGVVVTGLSSATDTITETSTARSNGDSVIFTDTGAATNVVAGRTYYVVAKATNSFKVATSPGGTGLTLGTATVSVLAPQTSALDVPTIGAFVQGVFDNGGLTGGEPTFLVNSSQKRAITNTYAAAYKQADPLIHGNNVGGVAIDQVETDFGTFNILLDRHVPQDAIIACSLNQLRPVFLNVPDKGCFFEEPLAKTGASDDVQIYGEIGLEYGNERAHGVIRGLKV